MKTLRAILLCAGLLLLAACNRYNDEEHEKNVLIGLLAHEKYGALEQALDADEQEYQQRNLGSKEWQGRWYGLANMSMGGMQKRMDEWVAKNDSGHAYLGRGMWHQVQAWKQLDDNEVDETQQRAEFTRLAHLAESDLLNANKQIPKCALCLAELINVNRALNKPLADSKKLLEQALQFDPLLPAVVNSYFVNLYPQWGGSLEKMRAFVDEMKRRGLDAGLVAGLESRYCWQQAENAGGDEAQVLQWLERGVTKEPYDVLMKQLAENYTERGELDKAAQVLEQNLLLNNPWDMRTIDLLARAYSRGGQKEKGNQMIDKRAEVLTRYSSYQ